MTQPNITQIGQYLKDMSFENFMATTQIATMPGVDISLDVTAHPLTKPDIADDQSVSGNYEVLLSIRITARAMGKDGAAPAENEPALFIVEIAFVGRYHLANVPQAEVDPFLLIEAPRLLFPFARQIVADAITHGGLPPLLLAPVDFVQLYHQRKARSTN